ncbi:MAG: hypothetical protein EB127_05965 [Alphaproteobacteria bacterium]|nr:hypothetical protein [Alphaproteobacteria bacterium]
MLYIPADYDFLTTKSMSNENQSTEPYYKNRALLHTALVKAIAETQDVVADSTNPFHKNKYASLNAHLSVIKPIFAKHGLAVIQFPSSDEKSIGVTTTIIHECGSQLMDSIHIPVPESITGQQAGAIISYLRRYALASVAGIATEDDDAESDRIARQPSGSSKPQTGASVLRVKDDSVVGTSGSVNFELPVPFGDAKGKPLNELPLKNTDRSLKCADLSYWAKVWVPKPFGTSTKISQRDLDFKASAEALYAIKNAEAQPTETQDEVPF